MSMVACVKNTGAVFAFVAVVVGFAFHNSEDHTDSSAK